METSKNKTFFGSKTLYYIVVTFPLRIVVFLIILAGVHLYYLNPIISKGYFKPTLFGRYSSDLERLSTEPLANPTTVRFRSDRLTFIESDGLDLRFSEYRILRRIPLATIIKSDGYDSIRQEQLVLTDQIRRIEFNTLHLTYYLDDQKVMEELSINNNGKLITYIKKR